MPADAAMKHAATITLTLPDGSTRMVAMGSTGLDLAQSISPGLAKAAVAVKLNGELADLSLPLTQDIKIEIVKRDSAEGLDLIRHDAAHVLAQAVQELFPGTQVTIGPVIENGFYYDFYREKPFTTDDFATIEKKMHDIVDAALPFTREVWARGDAIAYFKNKGEAFKAELISDLPETEEIKIYKQGSWTDLCRGPHMPTTKHVGHAFKLMKVAGAYWRGDSNREMLTRIYGTVWHDEKALQAHLTQLEEAEKRDHRKLGREMDLFHLQDEAPGSVFWHPKGFVIYNQLEQYIRRRLHDVGYVEVKTPQLMDSRFWEASGHWGKYRENMFVVPDVVPNTEEGADPFQGKKLERIMALKPMNCPAHVQVFSQDIRSYRDLPIRMAEFGCCHRNEAHGALHGILRLRQFTQDDAHIFCTEDQIMQEIMEFCRLVQDVYKDMGFENYVIKLETRPEKRFGSDDLWDRSEGALKEALENLKLPYTISPGDGAFYGPKLAFIIRDAIGREWGCGTIQLDYGLAERLDAHYVAADGSKKPPVVLHRAVLGAIERFVGIMIENYAGKLPLWLAPVQAVVATITSEADTYAKDVHARLHKMGLRAEIDLRNEKINYKIREHSLMKVPQIFVVGAREAAEQTVAIRTLGGEAQTVKPLEAALSELAQNAKPPY